MREGEGTRGWRGTGDTWLLVTSVTQQPPEVTGGQKARNPLLLGVTGVGGAPPGHPPVTPSRTRGHGQLTGMAFGDKGGQILGHSSAGDEPQDAPPALPCLSFPPAEWAVGFQPLFFSSSSAGEGFSERQQLPRSPPQKIGGTPGRQRGTPHFLPGLSPSPLLTVSLYYCNKCRHKSGRYWRTPRSLLLSYGNVISSVPGKFYKIVSGGIINRISSSPPAPTPPLDETEPERRSPREGVTTEPPPLPSSPRHSWICSPQKMGTAAKSRLSPAPSARKTSIETLQETPGSSGDPQGHRWDLRFSEGHRDSASRSKDSVSPQPKVPRDPPGVPRDPPGVPWDPFPVPQG